MVIPDETVKPVEDSGSGISADQEPAMDQSQEEMTSEQERSVEVDEVEQEVEGKLGMLFTCNGVQF